MAYVDENTGAAAYNWETGGIYQLEDNDPVQGGVGGVSNAQALELAKRTRNLHSRLVAILGAPDEAFNSLEKIQAAIESLDFSDVNLDELRTELRGAVAAELDTMEKIVDYIDGLSYLPNFSGRSELTGTTIDWRSKPELYREISTNTVFDASNLIEGKTICLTLTGAGTAAFTAKFVKFPGSLDPVAGKTNYIQMRCVNATTGSEKIYYTSIFE